jgi:hypothetical protein
MKTDSKIKYQARSLALGFCVLALSLFTAVPLLAQSNSTGKFIVSPADDIYADSARIYLEFFQARLSNILDYQLDTIVTLYLATSESEFLTDTGITPPDWGAGIAFLEKSQIVIKSPKYITTGKSLRELIGHELAHIMLYRAAGGRWLPRWIQEGFAMNQSGEWHIGQDILVARAAWTGRLIYLHEMEDLLTFKGAQAQLAYTESYMAMSRLLRQSDTFVLADMLKMYRKNGDFYFAWKANVGTDYATWTANWLTSISRQYHFLIFIWDNEMFWIILTIGVILLFIWKKRQNARTRRRWKIEDRINPPDDSHNQYYDGYYDEEDKV